MSRPIIEVKGLSKRYRLGELGARSLRDEAESLWDRIRGKNGPQTPATKSEAEAAASAPARSSSPITDFWALRDVSFSVQPGEVLGIIGRNGAGKSTLLKILSRITEPTEGEVIMRGRVASLLEVGTGFHPELSGRENIYLNGAILGMKSSEIDRKFDEIVAFTEVAKFIDTPVKRYSSGMYVRLAFGVAAYLEPDILILDEVLAVGDAAFQKKCLGKMNEIAKEGRTVLFVSHNMNAVESLCKTILHLDEGRVMASTSEVRNTVVKYLAPHGENDHVWINPGNHFCNPWFQPLRFYLVDDRGSPANMPLRNDTCGYVCIEGFVKEETISLNVGYALYSQDGALLYWSVNTDTPQSDWPRLQIGRNLLRSRIPMRLLNQGSYRVELLVAFYYREWLVGPGAGAPSLRLEIQGGLSDSPYWMEKRPGLLAPVIPWNVKGSEDELLGAEDANPR